MTNYDEYAELDLYQNYLPKGAEGLGKMMGALVEQQKQIRSVISSVKNDADKGIEYNMSIIEQLDNMIKTEVYQRIEHIDGRVEVNESSITQMANEIELKVSYNDYNGNEIASRINQTATTIRIQASKIDFVGAASFTLGNGSNGRTDVIGGGIFGDLGSFTEMRTNNLYLNNQRLATTLIGGSGEYGLTVNGVTLAYATKWHTHSVSVSSAGSHTHSANTGTAGAHNHGLQNGDQVMLVGGGYRTWSSAPAHDHNVTVSSAGNHNHSASAGSANN